MENSLRARDGLRVLLSVSLLAFVRPGSHCCTHLLQRVWCDHQLSFSLFRVRAHLFRAISSLFNCITYQLTTQILFRFYSRDVIRQILAHKQFANIFVLSIFRSFVGAPEFFIKFSFIVKTLNWQIKIFLNYPALCVTPATFVANVAHAPFSISFERRAISHPSSDWMNRSNLYWRSENTIFISKWKNEEDRIFSMRIVEWKCLKKSFHARIV